MGSIIRFPAQAGQDFKLEDDGLSLVAPSPQGDGIAEEVANATNFPLWVAMCCSAFLVAIIAAIVWARIPSKDAGQANGRETTMGAPAQVQRMQAVRAERQFIEREAGIYLDKETGCQYLVLGAAMAPRMDPKGHQICGGEPGNRKAN